MFCNYCGNKLGENDNFCPRCGKPVEHIAASGDMPRVPNNADPQSYGNESGKAPMFDFKWDVQDFPDGRKRETEDADFRWEKYKDTPIVQMMRGAADPERIAQTPTFSEENEREKAITDEWYEPFSMKKNVDDETLFRFNKRNEEFQELLDKEYERYNSYRRTNLPNEATKKYRIDDFREELERYNNQSREEVRLPEPQRQMAPNQNFPGFIDPSVVSPFGGPNNANQPTAPNPYGQGSQAIENDAYLRGLPTGDGRSFAGPQPVPNPNMANQNTQPQGQQMPQQPPLPQQPQQQGIAPNNNFGGMGQQKIIGPDIINQPVVFPFDMERDNQNQMPQSDIKLPPKADNAIKPTALPNEAIAPTVPNLSGNQNAVTNAPGLPPNQSMTPTAPSLPPNQADQGVAAVPKATVPIGKKPNKKVKNDEFKTRNRMIKFLIVMILITMVLLAGLLIMRMMPNSSVGILLTNLIEMVTNRGEAQNAPPDITQTVLPHKLITV